MVFGQQSRHRNTEETLSDKRGNCPTTARLVTEKDRTATERGEHKRKERDTLRVTIHHGTGNGFGCTTVLSSNMFFPPAGGSASYGGSERNAIQEGTEKQTQNSGATPMKDTHSSWGCCWVNSSSSRT